MAPEPVQTGVAARIDSICKQFEADWRRNGSPAIDDYVERAEAPDREALRRELIRVWSELLATDEQSTAFGRDTSASETVTFREAVPAPPDGLPEIPGYAIVGRIARGGMGEVLEARHQALDRPVAIKLPLAEQSISPAERERFLREARAAARLRHPHICTVYEIGEVAGMPYIAMDFIRGQTLKKWREARQPTARQTAETVALLCRAVDYAHKQGIVHRDIKPSNVIVEAASGSPVLMDFGLAKQLSGDAVVLTCSGQVMGTPAYMAPEQAAGRVAEVGPLADVYALGAVLYDLLCGRPPYQGNVGEVLARIQTAEPPTPRSVNPKIHRDLETICLKALAKAPAARYISALALAEDLERFSAGEPVLARRTPVAVRAWRRLRRNPLAAALFVVVLIVAAALGMLSHRASGVLEASRVTRAFEAGLDDGEFSDQHLKNMESLIDRLATVAAGEAGPARKRLYERYAGVHLDLLRGQTLEPELEARVLHAIDVLGDREPELVAALRQRLEERRQIWDKVIEVDGSTVSDAVFEAGSVARSGNRLLPVVGESDDGLEPATVLTLAGSRGAVEIDATFDAGWEEARQVGVMLNANAGHTAQIVSLSVSPDGTRLATGSLDGSAKLWDLRTGTVLATFRAAGGIRDAAVSPEGGMLATASYELKLWDLKTFAAVPNPCPAGSPIRAAFLPDRHVLALADPRAELTLLDLDTATSTVMVAGRDGVAAVALAGNGSSMAVGLEDGTIEVWDAGTGKRLGVCPGESPVLYLALTRDGRHGAAVRKDRPNVVQLFEGKTGRAGRRLPLRNDVSAFCFSNHGTSLAVAEWGGGIRLWDAANGELKAVFSESGNYHAHMQSLAFVPDDSALVGGGVQAFCQIWDAATFAERMRLAGSSYTFRLTAATAPLDEESPPNRSTPVTLRQARRLQSGFVLEIVRDGVRLSAKALLAQQVPSGDLRMVATRQDDRVAVRVNDLPPLEFYDTFPLARTRPGVFGLVWPQQAALRALSAHRKSPPAVPSGLERGDDAFGRGEVADAAEAYREASVASAGTTTGNEALFKLAACLTSLRRNDEARQVLTKLAASEGDRWPMLAACQIWLQYLREKRLAEAQEVFETLSARYGTEKFAQIIPSEVREQILAAYRAHATGRFAYALDANRVLNLERAAAVEQALGLTVDRYENIRWYLLRAYHMSDRIDDALALAKEVVGDAQPGELGFGFTWASEYAWLLSTHAERDRALEFLDRFLASATDRAVSYRLLLPRARIYCSQGRWQEAERDIDELFQFQPAEQMSEPTRSLACLVRGLLRQRRGDAAGALAAWRQGRLADRQHAMGATARLADAILASLIGDASDAEAEQVGAELIAAFAENTPLAATKNLFRLPPVVVREAWRTPRGRAAAERIAFGEVAMPELIRLPALVVGAETARQLCFGGVYSAEEETVVWDLAERAFGAYASGQVKTAQVVQVAMTLKGSNNFLGWQGLKPSLTPDLRAPMAYIFGCRYLRLGRPADARQFFQTAQEEAPADSPLSRRARDRLDAAQSASSDHDSGRKNR